MAHQVENLVATAISTSEIELSWDDVVLLDGETYDIERDGSILEYIYAGNHSVGTPYLDAGLAADTEYTYRVRAVGGTLDLGNIAGLVAWYSFDDPAFLWQNTARTTPITADGQAIKGVTDRSGNGYHLSEATNGPTYKTNILNGLSVMQSDGVNDNLINSAVAARPASTCFLVWRKLVAPIAGPIGAASFDPSGASAFLTNSGIHATNWLYRRNSAGSDIQIGAAATTWHIISFNVPSASSIVFRVDGGASTASFDPQDTVTTGTEIRFGVSSSIAVGDVYLAEFAVYNSSLSAANMDLVGNYLASKWGFTWTAVS